MASHCQLVTMTPMDMALGKVTNLLTFAQCWSQCSFQNSPAYRLIPLLRGIVTSEHSIAQQGRGEGRGLKQLIGTNMPEAHDIFGLRSTWQL
mmetsp:Transcript_24647/g.45164  ORF Transcript_24647/g.45164 Transcript_24647/m.45164 type:complete len:92 (+) Transcript_24647:453-728(+)